MKKVISERLHNLQNRLDSLNSKYDFLLTEAEKEREEGMISEETGNLNEINTELILTQKQMQQIIEGMHDLSQYKEVENGRIGIGTEVLLENHRVCLDIIIVPSSDSQPLRGRVSMTSPLGQALIGHGRGDKIIVDLPNTKTYYEIKAIR